MGRRILLILTCCVVFIGGKTQSPRQQAIIDSLLVRLHFSRSDTHQVSILTRLCSSLSTLDPDQGIHYGTRAFELATRLRWTPGIIRSCEVLADCYDTRSDHQQGLEQLQLALQACGTDGDPPALADLLYRISNEYGSLEDYVNALDAVLKAAEIYDQTGNRKRLGYMYNSAGQFYFFLNQFEKEEKILGKAILLHRELQDTNGLAQDHFEIGRMYAWRAMPDSALKHLQYARAFCLSVHDTTYLTPVLMLICKVYLDASRSGPMLEFSKSWLPWLEKNAAPHNFAIALTFTGIAWRNVKNYSMARYYQNRALEIGNRIDDPKVKAWAYYELYTISIDQGKFRDALEYYKLRTAEQLRVDRMNSLTNLNQLEYRIEFTRRQLTDSLRNEQARRSNLVRLQRQRSLMFSSSGITVIVSLFLVILLLQRNRLRRQKKYSDDLLRNILPAETAEELKKWGAATVRTFDLVTIMFTDFKDFIRVSERMTPEELVSEINYCYSEFDRIIGLRGIEKIKTIGDAYMCAGGLPEPNVTHAADVVSAALEIQEFMAQHNRERAAAGAPFFELRIGIHTGPVVAGIVGIKKFSYDIWGDSVNLASRMESSGKAGRVNISQATYQLVKDQFVCEYRGKVAARHIGEIEMYFVTGGAGNP